MTKRNAFEAITQQYTEPAAATPDAAGPSAAPSPFVGEDPWLIALYARLQAELTSLYEAMQTDDGTSRRRTALILRALDLMETGDYGQCACCNSAISRDRLEADPTRDTCEDCG